MEGVLALLLTCKHNCLVDLLQDMCQELIENTNENDLAFVLVTYYGNLSPDSASDLAT